MATIKIGDRNVQVDDSFLKLSPDAQNEAVDEITAKLKSPDKYEQAAADEYKANPALETQTGFTRRLAHGLTLGADNTILAAATAIPEAIKHAGSDLSSWDIGRNFSALKEGYNYAKGREDYLMSKARANTGALGTATEILGGVGSGAGLAKGGVTLAKYLAPDAGIFARSVASAGDAAALGGFSGAMEGNGIKERAENAAIGAGVGGVIGGGAPGTLKILGGLFSPAVSNFRAWKNPKGFAESQVARGIHESGITPNQMSLEAVQAANEGQGVYTLADTMGNAGQRMLSTVTRAPGEGRTMAVQALESRQGDQGRRMAGAFREAFDAPQTAEQTRLGMVGQANREAAINYQPVKADQTAIDVTYPVAVANRAISPAADRLAQSQGALATELAARAGIEAQESVLRDPIANALKEARSYLAAPTLTASNVNKAFRAKTNIDMMIAKATENNQGALVGELIPVRDALDEALARTSSNYAGARDAYRIAQQRIEALDLGKLLGSKPVRPEDSIRQFSALDAPQQEAFRRGYVDPQISQVQNAAFGTNKARPFTSDAVKQEFDAFATPGRADQLQRQVGREQTMFETRNAAMGGSKTVDNLNDHGAMSVEPHLIGQIMTGNWHGAVKTALAAGQNVISGNTPAVRREVANILLQTGSNIAPAKLERMVDETVRRIQFVQAIAQNVGRGAAGGVAVGTPNVVGQRR